MPRRRQAWRRLATVTGIVTGVFLLISCASYSGYTLQPGLATQADVVATMGQPAMTWQNPDGSAQLAYPRGPAGPHTFMVFIAANGRLERIEQVLTMAHFARVQPGVSDQAAVLRLIGPSYAPWTEYFAARDELVWEWQFCDSWNQLARFDVLFDAATGIVRTAYQRQALLGPDGVAPFCGN